jgi:hypothetical protein
LISDYGNQIETHLRDTQQKKQVSPDHLRGHKITAPYRAKMIDWMVEVLTAFKCKDQTFFLAINIMDRYFDKMGKDKQCLELQELHLTGIVCMFLASKMEDIYPLLMKTVYSKIGHSKIPVDHIRAKEIEILRTLSFNIISPTPYDFLGKYIEQILSVH